MTSMVSVRPPHRSDESNWLFRAAFDFSLSPPRPSIPDDPDKSYFPKAPAAIDDDQGRKNNEQYF